MVGTAHQMTQNPESNKLNKPIQLKAESGLRGRNNSWLMAHGSWLKAES